MPVTDEVWLYHGTDESYVERGSWDGGVKVSAGVSRQFGAGFYLSEVLDVARYFAKYYRNTAWDFEATPRPVILRFRVSKETYDRWVSEARLLSFAGAGAQSYRCDESWDAQEARTRDKPVVAPIAGLEHWPQFVQVVLRPAEASDLNSYLPEALRQRLAPAHPSFGRTTRFDGVDP
jgi:hypothetical protein